jgi:ABC-type nitrate/sulfonate/bicarbonate transport system substrate-binding protein
MPGFAARARLFVMLFLACASPASAQTVLRVGLSQPIYSFLPLDVGIEAGIFARNGITIEKTVFAGSARLHQAIAAGAIDIGLGAGPELGFIAKGAPERAVAAMADLPRELAISVLKDGPIKTVADLKGKRLSVSTKGSLTEWGGQELSRQQGWGSDGIRLLPLGSFGAQIAALKTHQIDGIIAEASTAGRIEEQGLGRTLLTFENLVPHFHIHMIFASTAIMHDHPDAVRQFLAGWFQSVDQMRADKPQAVTTASKVLELSPALSAQLYDALMPMYNNTGRFDPAALDTIVKAEIDMGDLKTKPDVSKLIDPSFLPAGR